MLKINRYFRNSQYAQNTAIGTFWMRNPKINQSSSHPCPNHKITNKNSNKKLAQHRTSNAKIIKTIIWAVKYNKIQPLLKNN